MSAYDLRTWSAAHPHAQHVDRARFETITAVFNAKQQNVTTSDTVKIIDIPADSFVLGVRAETVTVEGTTCTFKIGDAATADGYFATFDLNSAANEGFSFNATTTPTFGVGKYYSAAGYILLTPNNNASNAVLKLSVVLVRGANALPST